MSVIHAGDTPTEITSERTFHEDEVVARIIGASKRREKPTVVEPVTHQTLAVFMSRVESAEKSLARLRVLILGAILLTVLALTGLVAILVRDDANLDETRKMLDDTVKKPIEQLQQSVDRLERKLP